MFSGIIIISSVVLAFALWGRRRMNKKLEEQEMRQSAIYWSVKQEEDPWA